MSDRYDGENFFTMQDGQRMATPLLLALAVIEVSDVVFAVDSVPAVCSFRFIRRHSLPSRLTTTTAPPQLMAPSQLRSRPQARPASMCQVVHVDFILQAVAVVSEKAQDQDRS